MIDVKNINKYFNKNKSNEIHVINDTTLEFPKVGLVCLLGASGSGKTTLLNVIGGLDKIDKGEINFKDYSIKKYKASKWDYIRNRHFGYIFQNYILLQDLNVYQNLELVLKMLNLEKNEIDKRIDYALEAVGMLKYKKRKPTQLSGGQQQRVAIARALVKSPDVVIADEPTGNLDEKNTTQIMNIIKKISRECLVILVTHERRLAEFYGDRIIEISDGKVFRDELIEYSNDFEELDNNNIYLQDLNKEDLSVDDTKINYFYKDNKAKLDLNIIFKDNTFYINSNLENIKIKFLDKSSEIKVVDSKKPVISKQKIEDFDYHLPKLEYKEGNNSVIKFGDTIKMASNHLGGLKRKQKLLFVVMFLSTIMIVIGFTNLFSSRHVDEKDFLYFNRNLVTVKSDTVYDDVKKVLKDDEIILHHPNENLIFALNNGYFNHKRNEIDLRDPDFYRNTSSVIPIETVKVPKVIDGRLPKNNSEAVIDKYLVDLYLKNPNFTAAGIKYTDQFIGLTFSMDMHKVYGEVDRYKIVGIIENNNPNFYITQNAYKNQFVSNVIMQFGFFGMQISNNDDINDLHFYQIDENGIEKNTPVPIGELNLNSNQIIVNRNFYENFIKSRQTSMLNIGYGYELEVVGFVNGFDVSNGNNAMIYLNEDIVNDYYDKHIKSYYSVTIHSQNPEDLILRLKNKNIDATTIYSQEYERVLEYTINRELFIASIVVLAASLVFLFFLMRSSMLDRIYQIGVYRALGIKKHNIYKIFFTEILIITLITSLIGILLVSFIVNRVNQIIEVIYYPWFIAPMSLVFMLVVNVFVGLLPVNRLLRLTPSQILSKYDI